MALFYAYQNRGITKRIVIQDSAGSTITPGANDKIRAIIGRDGQFVDAPQLSVSSDAATANGSSFTKNSPTNGTNTLRLDASDLGFEPGTYTLLIDYFDNADAGEWKNVSRQVFVLEAT